MFFQVKFLFKTIDSTIAHFTPIETHQWKQFQKADSNVYWHRDPNHGHVQLKNFSFDSDPDTIGIVQQD